MSGKARFPAVIVMAVMLAGCVAPATQRAPIDPELAAREAEKQQDLAVAEWIGQQNRLARISHRLMTGAVNLCGERVRPMIGVYFLGAPDSDPALQKAFNRYNSHSDEIHIVGVVEGSPAAAAGVEPGYALVKLGGWSVPTGKGAIKETFEKLGEVLRVGEPVELVLHKLGDRKVVTIVPVAGCDYGVLVADQVAVNAYADGDRVVITKGMMRFAQSDTELANVVAHEIAHNVMGHIEAKRTNVLAGAGVGLIFDILAAAAGVNTQGEFSKIGAQAGRGAYSQEFEAEADYVALYIMANAGMDVSDTPNFWRRMAVAHPASIQTNHAASHPSTPERFLGLENTVAEIARKRASGAPLTPEMKVEPAARSAKPSRDTPGYPE
ncbi:MAG: M48 family metalloprotease [Proteobacteria bacterium]|nr:M48 family metalloprotease [Pseudomonadota bacterium]